MIWLIWADCDDVFAGDFEGFRERLEAAPTDLKMVRCLYDVRGSNKKLFRERAIRRSAFQSNRRWHHDVHENLLILDGDRHEDWDAPVWIHAPVEVRRENRRRNLRILAHSVRETPTQYFYIHQEHYCSANRDAALEFGKVALAFPNLQPAFRYEALLNCARLCGSSREANLYLMEAHGIYPWCREALAARGLAAQVFSGLPMPTVADTFTQRDALAAADAAFGRMLDKLEPAELARAQIGRGRDRPIDRNRLVSDRRDEGAVLQQVDLEPRLDEVELGGAEDQIEVTERIEIPEIGPVGHDLLVILPPQHLGHA